jgi:hypothetical protein
MSRNRFVELAKQYDCDVLVMCDSDQDPMFHEGEHDYKPFFETAFDFLYDHYEKGPTCLFAPYCGPPNGTENVYVFQWETVASGRDSRESGFSLEQYTRAHAGMMSGIQEAAAGPTGMIMYDMRMFDLIEPPYFHYDWTDKTQSEKGSTEDVQNLRDLSLAGCATLGYNPVFCCWDSWVGHIKPWTVGRPRPVGADQISANFKEAVLQDRDTNKRIIEVKADPDILRSLGVNPLAVIPEHEVPTSLIYGAHEIDVKTKTCINCGEPHNEELPSGYCNANGQPVPAKV